MLRAAAVWLHATAPRLERGDRMRKWRPQRAEALCAQPMEIYVDDEAKLTLHGLVQHYIMLNEEEKNRKLNDLLDALDFNQVCACGAAPSACLHPLITSCVQDVCTTYALHVLQQKLITCMGHGAPALVALLYECRGEPRGGAGGHLCEVSHAGQGAEQAAGGVQLPIHLHPPRHEAGGAVRTT